MEIKYYIGIDIGHGETCVSRVPGYNGESISRLPLRKANRVKYEKIISAIGRKNGKWGFVFPREACTCEDIRAGFKGRIDTLTERDKESLKEFVGLVFKTILKNDPELVYDPATGEANFMICFANPTGWRKDDPRVPDEYLRFMRHECGILPAHICINESDAAFYTKHKFYKSDDVVLVVDLGSSTIDYTVFCPSKGGSIEYNYGSNTGACRIEDAIVSRGYNLKNSEIDNVAGIAKVSEARKKAGMNGDCEVILQLFARDAKEDFFTNGGDFFLDIKEKDFATGLSGFSSAFAIKFTPDEMFNLTEEYRTNIELELGNVVAKQLRKRNIEPTQVLLSGGASKMGFVEEIAQSVFPNAKIICDPHPEWVVSDGAALYLKVYHAAVMKKEKLHEDFQKWCDDNLERCLKESAVNAFNDTLHNTLEQRIGERYYDESECQGSLNEFEVIAKEELEKTPRTSDFKHRAERLFTEAVDGRIKGELTAIIAECYGKTVNIDTGFITPGETFYGVNALTGWLHKYICKCADTAFNIIFHLEWDIPRSLRKRTRLVEVFMESIDYKEFNYRGIDLHKFVKEAHGKIDQVLHDSGLFAVSDIACCDDYKWAR